MDTTLRKAIEKRIGYRFKRRSRLATALTHPSYRHENEGIEEDNQRLEFLGDAVLGLLAASECYERFPEADEGTLTHLRSLLANRDTLAARGRDWELGPALRLGRGEERSGGRDRASNLTDAVEALIGAIYLDGGMKAVQKVYRAWWSRPDDLLDQQALDNPKGRLQEFCQQKWKVSPVYQVVHESGPAHARAFTCITLIKGKPYAEGHGTNKRAAEADAARETLRYLQSSAQPSPVGNAS